MTLHTYLVRLVDSKVDRGKAEAQPAGKKSKDSSEGKPSDSIIEIDWCD
jgi:hypothetical protein